MKKLFVLFAILAIALAACAPSASASVVGEWTLVSYGDPANPESAAPEVETFIIFDEKGEVGGTFGCNGFGGEFEVDGEAIRFGQLVSTLMFCEGAAGEQESVGFKVFSERATFSIEGDTLTITSADGSAVIVLVRK